MKRNLTIILLALTGLGATAPGVTPQSQDRAPVFGTLDIIIDPMGLPLAAWQVRLVDPTGRLSVVGVEGGEDANFAEPPHHDPALLVNGVLLLAAYDTSGTGPNGRTRVARVHVASDAGAPLNFQATLEVAASPAGAIPGAQLELVP